MARTFRAQTDLEEFTKARLDENGHEIVSNIPKEPPLNYVKQPSMVDIVRSQIRSEMLRREVEAAGVETFEEADDFNVEDDPADPSTPFEENFDPPPERLTEEEWSAREKARYTSDEYTKLKETRTPPAGGVAPKAAAEPPPAPAPAGAPPGLAIKP